ncbi:MAG TPA: hypothetical protein PKD83_12350, partial [Ignavibacteria bacterium]|nr:hypothetical protein [Ignavibacteria bacterium]
MIFIKSSIAQLQFFDSVKTVVSSSIYDYKNPVFNGESTNSNFSWLAYERHNGNSSDIVVRKAGYTDYDSEIVITNTVNALNINPTIYKGMIVWQSNVRGNWDLYYSKLISGVSWSAPVLVDSSSFDETNPYVVNNNLEPEQYNYTFLVYKRNNSIRFKKYKTTSGIWSNDTLVTDGTYEDATPMICKGSSGAQFGVVFLRKYSANVSRLNQRLFYENYNNSPIVWDNVYEIFQPNPQNNLSLSYTGLEFLSYSYDTLNSTHILGFNLNGQNFKEVITKNVPGKHLSGKGSLMGIVLDNMYYFFSVFSTITRFSDSLYLTFINHPGSFN